MNFLFFIFYFLFCKVFAKTLHHHSGEHKAEYRSDMHKRAVGILLFFCGMIFQQLITVNTLELAAWQLTVVLKPVAQGPCQWTALHLPELGNLNSCRVAFESRPHRGEKRGICIAGIQNQQRLVFQTVYGINDIVIITDMKRFRRVLVISLPDSRDFSIRVDVQQTFPQHIHLHLPHC